MAGLPAKRFGSPRAGRPETDVQASDASRLEPGHPLERGRQAEVEPGSRCPRYAAEPLDQADLARPDRVIPPVAYASPASPPLPNAIRVRDSTTAQPARGPAGRRTARSAWPPPAAGASGGSAQSPKTSSRMALSRTSSEPSWWRIAAATGPRTPSAARTTASALKPKAKTMMFCRMTRHRGPGQPDQGGQVAERIAQDDQVARLGREVRPMPPRAIPTSASGQRGGVVDAVAHHRHPAARLPAAP